MKAVLYGAGNVGRGFIAELFSEAGMEVVFLDLNQRLIDAINKQHAYRQVVVGKETTQKLIRGVRAVNCENIEMAAQEISDCTVMATAVGADILTKIAPVIAKGLHMRWIGGNIESMNILICENLNHADAILMEAVKSSLPLTDHDLLQKLVGFVETSIGRMIPIMPEKVANEDPAVIYVEPYRYLPYDCAAVKGILPHIPMGVPFTPFSFYVERKLFIHNMGHLICALLGHMRGLCYMWEAVEDAEIYILTRAAMESSAIALASKYHVELSMLLAHVDDLLYRFSNKELGDSCARVSRGLPRKLAPDDRLLGAARLCEEQHVFSAYIYMGIALAQYYASIEPQGMPPIVSQYISCFADGFDFKRVQNIIRQHKYENGLTVI